MARIEHFTLNPLVNQAMWLIRQLFGFTDAYDVPHILQTEQWGGCMLSDFTYGLHQFY